MIFFYVLLGAVASVPVTLCVTNVGEFMGLSTDCDLYPLAPNMWVRTTPCNPNGGPIFMTLYADYRCVSVIHSAEIAFVGCNLDDGGFQSNRYSCDPFDTTGMIRTETYQNQGDCANGNLLTTQYNRPGLCCQDTSAQWHSNVCEENSLSYTEFTDDECTNVKEILTTYPKDTCSGKSNTYWMKLIDECPNQDEQYSTETYAETVAETEENVVADDTEADPVAETQANENDDDTVADPVAETQASENDDDTVADPVAETQASESNDTTENVDDPAETSAEEDVQETEAENEEDTIAYIEGAAVGTSSLLGYISLLFAAFMVL